MVPEDSSPVADEVGIRLSSNPWQTGGESDHRVGEAVDIDAYDATGKLVQIDARNADVFGSRQPGVLILGIIPIAAEAQPELGNEGGTEHMGVVDRARLSAIDSRSSEPACFWPAIDAIQRWIEHFRPLKTVPN